MEMATIIAFGIGFFTGGAVIGWFVYLNSHIDSRDWGDPRNQYNGRNGNGYQPIPGFTSGEEEWVDPPDENAKPIGPPNKKFGYSDIPAFLRRQAD